MSWLLIQLIFMLTIQSIVLAKSYEHQNHHHYKINFNQKPTKIHYAVKQNDEFVFHEFDINDELPKDFFWSAKGMFDSDNYNITGWSVLEIETNENETDVDQAFSAGLLEAHLTKDLIWLHILNINPEACDGSKDECEQLYNFIGENFKWITNQILDHPEDPYWHHVNLVLLQFSGLYHGYKKIYKQQIKVQDFPEMIETRESAFMKILGLQIHGEDDEILFKVKNIVDPFWASACSALIKVVDNNDDIFVSHNTWFQYETMLRIAKHFKFNYHYNSNYDILVPGVSISFSSYPGLLSSFDDFYLTSSNLTVLETTIGNSNVDLWKYTTPQSVSYWIRNLVANRLSSNGIAWAQWFSLYNSGTYNNQWMIIDYKKFTPQQPLRDGLFVIAEQIPGKVIWKDMTDVLRERSYWSSYNLPYFDEIANISGNYENVAKYGETLFSHDHSARASIFRRDHVKVNDIFSMIKLMRYNNYKEEPYSKCNCNPPYSAFLSISARTDLNDVNGTYEYSVLSHRDHGATDLKVTSSLMSQNLEFIAINGPTYDDVPPFVWSETDFGKTTNHFGHPDKFQFQPLHLKWSF